MRASLAFLRSPTPFADSESASEASAQPVKGSEQYLKNRVRQWFQLLEGLQARRNRGTLNQGDIQKIKRSYPAIIQTTQYLMDIGSPFRRKSDYAHPIGPERVMQSYAELRDSLAESLGSTRSVFTPAAHPREVYLKAIIQAAQQVLESGELAPSEQPAEDTPDNPNVLKLQALHEIETNIEGLSATADIPVPKVRAPKKPPGRARVIGISDRLPKSREVSYKNTLRRWFKKVAELQEINGLGETINLDKLTVITRQFPRVIEVTQKLKDSGQAWHVEGDYEHPIGPEEITETYNRLRSALKLPEVLPGQLITKEASLAGHPVSGSQQVPQAPFEKKRPVSDSIPPVKSASPPPPPPKTERAPIAQTGRPSANGVVATVKVEAPRNGRLDVISPSVPSSSNGKPVTATPQTPSKAITPPPTQSSPEKLPETTSRFPALMQLLHGKRRKPE